MDFLTDLPTTPDGFDSIMVMVDHSLMKGVILQPCNKTINALQTAEVIIQTIYRRFGLLDKLISDRGPQFASAVFQEISKLLGIKHAMSTAYHPQTDGTTEHYMQEIKTYLLYFESDLMERISDYFRDCTQLQNTRRTKTFIFRTMVWIPIPISNIDT